MVRLNLAHDTAAAHRRAAAGARAAAEELGRAVGVLVDLPGPKMRTGAVHDDAVTLEIGKSFTITTDAVTGDAGRVSTTIAALPAMVAPGDAVFLADGAIVLEVVSVADLPASRP